MNLTNITEKTTTKPSSSLKNMTSPCASDDSSSDSGSGVVEDLDDHNNGNEKSEKQKAAKEERRTIAKNETRAVKHLRIFVFVVLFLTASLVTIFVFRISRKGQEENFEASFFDDADRIVDAFHDSVERKLGAMDSLSGSITSYAKSSGSTFPNVTLPDFETRAASTRVLADGLYILYQPLVSDETRKQWEAYSTANHGHLMPAFMSEYQLKGAQDYKYGYVDPDDNQRRHLQLEGLDQGFRDEIWGTDGNGETEAEGTGPYLPLWQFSPVLPLINFLNLNVRDMLFYTGAYDEVLQERQASFGPLTNLKDPNDEGGEAIKVMNAMLASGQYRHTAAQYVADPVCSLAYPVFDNFNAVDRKVVGIITTAIYWTMIFANQLASSSRGMIAVIENNLGQSETYRIDGPNVTYVGSGNLHDSHYEYLEQTEDVIDAVTDRAGPETRSYTATDLNADYIRYRLRLFPSDEMRDQHVTNEPLINAAVVASVFVFTSIMFLIYDRLVERRQTIVLDKAVKSTAVVRSLFPETVQDRLYEDAEAPKSKPGAKMRNSDAFKISDTNKLMDSNKSPLSMGETMMRHQGDRPIADLFPNTTVLFADIAGFTKWSSSRTPVDVFTLLEAIYGGFDAIAARRSVFKVETIGDCYVAVTGLPQVQPNHAVIMAKFARDCQTKLQRLVTELKDGHLGEETGDLSLRIGLHSGEVTAGVLRGEKSRFQLFGDTVNTAARMESNGVVGRIHCSQATADKLIEAGKSSWLVTREGLIDAKGKGKMQTYWVEPMMGNKSTHSVFTTVLMDDEDMAPKSSPRLEP